MHVNYVALTHALTSHLNLQR